VLTGANSAYTVLFAPGFHAVAVPVTGSTAAKRALGWPATLANWPPM
jgi:hypothetical protein